MNYFNYCLNCAATPSYEDFGRECTFVISEYEVRDGNVSRNICRFFCVDCLPNRSWPFSRLPPVVLYPRFRVRVEHLRQELIRGYYQRKLRILVKTIPEACFERSARIMWKGIYMGAVVDYLTIVFKYDQKSPTQWEFDGSLDRYDDIPE